MAAGLLFVLIWASAFTSARFIVLEWSPLGALALRFIIAAPLVALVVILLNLISVQARADEFALLLAVGHTRRRLVGKLLVESGVVALVAWALGLALGFLCLGLYDRIVLEPKAIEIRFFDAYPIALASLLPLVSAAASAVVLALRLSRMDPVSVIQRRNA